MSLSTSPVHYTEEVCWVRLWFPTEQGEEVGQGRSWGTNNSQWVLWLGFAANLYFLKPRGLTLLLPHPESMEVRSKGSVWLGRQGKIIQYKHKILNELLELHWSGDERTSNKGKNEAREAQVKVQDELWTRNRNRSSFICPEISDGKAVHSRQQEEVNSVLTIWVGKYQVWPHTGLYHLMPNQETGCQTLGVLWHWGNGVTSDKYI